MRSSPRTSLPLALLLCALGSGPLAGAVRQAGDRPSAAPAPAEVDEKTRQRARALLGAVEERLAEVAVLRAAYVQRRTSPLLVEPLISKGQIYQRSEPACLLFEVQTPSRARVRVDARTYQVHRPDEGTAERFVFEGVHAGTALLEGLRPDPESLFRRFTLLGLEEADGIAAFSLQPRDARARRHVDNVVLRIGIEAGVPRGLSYVDREGYEVDLSLSDVSLDPEDDPALEDAGAHFSADLPDGVELLVHRVEAEDEAG